MYTLQFHPEAKIDIIETVQWYDEQKEDLGLEFLEALEKELKQLQSNPLIFAIIKGDTRRAIIRRFKYCIYYEIIDSTVWVMAVLRDSRSPKVWQERGSDTDV